MNRATELKKYFYYNSETGVFTWKRHRCVTLVGKVAGCFSKPNGYWLLTLHNKKMLAHKAAWAIYYGYWPRFELDHRDLCKSNNKIKNLRRSNKSNNGANRPPQATNTSGYKGVFWHKRGQKWMAQVRCRNKLHYLGLFSSKVEAAKAYDAKAIVLFGAHARLNLESVL